MVFVYARPNAMVNHEFKDDVAIVRARSKKEAVECLKKYYEDANEKNVRGIHMNMNQVHILTDY